MKYLSLASLFSSANNNADKRELSGGTTGHKPHVNQKQKKNKKRRRSRKK